MEHEAEYETLVRLGDSHDELLRMGHVAARVEDTKAWRDEAEAAFADVLWDEPGWRDLVTVPPVELVDLNWN